MPRVRAHRLLLPCLALVLSACASSGGVPSGNEELGLDPEDSPAELYVRMAEQYHARGQLDVAFRRAQQAVATDKRYPRAHVWLAYLYEQLDRLPEADRHYARAVELSPNNPDVLHAHGSYLCRQKRYAEGDARFVKALANPLYATPWVANTAAGNCALGAGETAKAEAYFQAAVRTNPNFGPALVKLAALAANRDDNRTAKTLIDRYFENDSLRTPASSLEALQVGARVERRLGNAKRAAYYEQVLKANFPTLTSS
ncbi:MAG: type IV pilus biogenesis/stability protein PilW [Chromatiaceae bacterium]|nr:type IV pilus biogenesis/stability protein PilW [Chromatiaceae bacterium]